MDDTYKRKALSGMEDWNFWVCWTEGLRKEDGNDT